MIQKPNRLFTFGCSFTHYRWATWANILGFELDCEFYNFGKSGAGNAYIANQVSQADNFYNFDNTDLVVVSWTNISREDRFTDRNGWITPGNIYSQNEYDSRFVKQYANETHFELRDFSQIYLIDKLLQQKTNHMFIAMCDIVRHINQWENGDVLMSDNVQKLSNLYSESLGNIKANFYDILWDSNIDNKWKKDWKEIHPHFSDGHPTPIEHLEFLKKVYPNKISKKTNKAVHKLHNEWRNFIQRGYAKTRKDCGIHSLPQHWQEELFTKFQLRDSLANPQELFH